MAQRTCSVEGCERPVYARGWCNTHWARWRRTGSVSANRPFRIRVAAEPICRVPGCVKPTDSVGLCGMHYWRLRQHGTLALPDRPPRLCAIAGCGRGVKGQGYCSLHLQRLKTSGDPLVRSILRGADPAERFWQKVAKGHPDACWLWTGTCDKQGYGFLWLRGMGGDRIRAHRFAYALLVGPIPEGMTIDHRCHGADKACAGGPTCAHRRCVNPDHLRPASSVDNVMRGRGVSVRNAAKTHCIRGHAFDDANTIWLRGRRRCRTCVATAYPLRKDSQ